MCVDIILRHFLQTNAVISVWLIARRHWRRFPWPWFLSRLDGADESHSWTPKGSWSGVTEMVREEKDTRGCIYEMERVQKQAGGWNVEREDQGKDVETREQTEAQEGKYIEQRRWTWRLSGEMRGVRASGVRVCMPGNVPAISFTSFSHYSPFGCPAPYSPTMVALSPSPRSLGCHSSHSTAPPSTSLFLFKWFKDCKKGVWPQDVTVLNLQLMCNSCETASFKCS